MQSRGAARIPGIQPTPAGPASPVNQPPPANSSGPVDVPDSGPTLQLPEARSSKLAPQSAELRAPAPTSRTARFRPTVANQISSTPPETHDDPHWSSTQRSTDQRAIETLLIGSGTHRVAVLGSMHGDEPQSVALVSELARQVKRHPEWMSGMRLLLIRSPNPDGLFGRSALNLNGIDINRNFPSHNWKALKSGRAGEHAATEVETQAIMRLLREFEPQLVIHVKDHRGVGTINCEGQTTDVSAAAARVHYDVVHGLGVKTSGSLENFVTSRMHGACLTLLLPVEASDALAWERNQELLTTCLGVRDVSPVASAPEVKPIIDRDPAPAAPQARRRTLPVTDTKRPASQTETRQNDFPAPVPKHGYLELPPPPQG